MMAACPAEPPSSGAFPCAAADRQAADLDDLLARLPHRTGAEMYEEMRAARRAMLAAPPPEQTIIPVPELPPLWPRVGAGGVRYGCALRCGWGHVEDMSLSVPGPIVFRPDEPGSFERALTERANADAAALRDRVEAAVREHFTAAHPGVVIPTRGVA